MDFLQRPAYAAPTKKDEKVTSKFRGKGKRKAVRGHDEISTFFRVAKIHLVGTSPNVQHNASTINKPKQVHPNSISRWSDIGESSYLNYGQPGLSTHNLSTSRRRHAISNRLEIEPDIDNRNSGRATTYVTWSETIGSPHGTTPPKYYKYDRDQISPTPDSVRISIEKTGIFRDTGISMSPEKALHQIISPTCAPHAPLSQDVGDTERTARNLSTTVLTRSTASPSSGAPEKLAKLSDLRCQKSSPRNSTRYHKIADRRSNSPRTENPVPNADTHPHQMVTENSNKRSGRAPNEGSENTPVVAPQHIQDSYELRESKRTPIDREQLARRARIRRPSTTLPVTRVERAAESLQGIVANRKSRLTPDNSVTLAQPTNTTAKEMASAKYAGQERESDNGNASKFSDCQTRINRNALHPLETSLQYEERKPSPRQDGVHLLEARLNNATDDKNPQQQGLHLHSRSISGTLLGLPVQRFSWVGSSWEERVPNIHLSQINEVAPLYLHQVERVPTGSDPEVSAERHVEAEHQEAEDNLVESDEMLNCSLEDLGGEYLAGREEANALIDDQYNDWHQPINEAYPGIEATTSENWEYADQAGTRTMENSEQHQYTAQSMPYLSRSQGVYTHSFDIPDRRRQTYQDYYAQDGLPLLDLWRPNRHY